MKIKLRHAGLVLTALLGATTVFAWAGPEAGMLADDPAPRAASSAPESPQDAEASLKKTRVKVFVSEDGEAHEVTGDDHVWIRHLEDLEGLEDLPEDLAERLAALHDGQVRVHRVHGGPWGSGTLLGVEMTPMSAELRRHFGAPDDRGVMVSRVVEDSPALAAGLRVGDIVTDVDGEAIESPAALARLIGDREPGDVVQVSVIRERLPQTVTATLTKRQGVPEMHRLSAGDLQQRKVVVICKDGEDCDMNKDFDVPCGDAENCEIQVQCNGGDCTCTVNGETVDCEQIPGH